MAFTVHSRLGRGRTVDTYSATLVVGEERLEVVVKRPRPDWAQDPNFRQTFLKWGNDQVDVDHDNVVAVLEVGETDEGAYAIQEHVDGVPLGELLRALRKKRRTLTPAHAFVVADRVAKGLAYLQQEGRPGHGSLDPDKVFISYEGEVRIADQGLFTLVNIVDVPPLPSSDPSRAYIPPEVVAGGAPDKQSDVYAWGLVLLEMLIGHPVWSAASMTVKDSLAALRDFTQLGQASPQLAEDILQLLKSCLEDAPDARAQTADSVAQSMSSLIQRHGINVDDEGLGRFIDAVLPKESNVEAATVMVDPAEAERMAQRRARATDWDAASVMINPEIERRAQEGMKGSKGIELLAASVSLNDATPEGLEDLAKATAERKAAPTSSRSDSVAPLAPSIRRDQAQALPDVAQVAARAQASFDGGQRWIILAALGGLLVLGLIIWGVASRGSQTPEPAGSARTVQLKATSVPSSASVFVDGEFVGQTPLDMPVAAQGVVLKLRFELLGHEPHEVSIGSEADELRYEASMKSLPAP